jgi:hypothetical protein
MARQGYGSDYFKARDEQKKTAKAGQSSSTPKADESGRIANMLEELNNLEDGLSEWEMNFVDDLMDRGASGPFSPKQASTIEKIWDEKIGKTQ